MEIEMATPEKGVKFLQAANGHDNGVAITGMEARIQELIERKKTFKPLEIRLKDANTKLQRKQEELDRHKLPKKQLELGMEQTQKCKTKVSMQYWPWSKKVARYFMCCHKH